MTNPASTSELTSELTSEIIRPIQSRWETVLLGTAIVGLVLLTSLYTTTFGREEKTQELLDWQISSFSDLRGADQAIYNEMLVAADEINWMLYYSGYWPDMPDFQDAWLPPFYQDLSWERNGSVQWVLDNVIQEGEAQGLTLYHGSGGTLEGQGAYLMVIDHKHAGNAQVIVPSMWWHSDNNAPVPSHSKIPSLVLAGWKQVIAYQGRDELERLGGG